MEDNPSDDTQRCFSLHPKQGHSIVLTPGEADTHTQMKKIHPVAHLHTMTKGEYMLLC